MILRDPFVRRHLFVCLAITILTAIGSSAYFHIDEHFQILEPVFFKLGKTEAWTLPFELKVEMRPWLQPGFYFLVAKALAPFGVTSEIALATVFRLVTGVLSVAALAAFIETALPWFEGRARRVFVRFATMLGFLPYLFVRTSSETASMIAFTFAFAVALRGARKDERWTLALSNRGAVATGLLLGVAFEARYQTAFLSLGLVAWLAVVARARVTLLARVVFGGVLAVGACILVDRWGYGAVRFPALTYFQTNVVEGMAELFGAEPPFAYLWLLPANVFFPVVVVVIVLVVVSFVRDIRHPVTWSILPFVLVHNLLAHKEERFLFPIAILMTASMTIAIDPSGRPLAIGRWLWARRTGVGVKVLGAWSIVMMTLLAVWPLGWHHHVRFTQHVRQTMGDELHAHALLDYDLGLPAYHPRVYHIEKLSPEDLGRRIEAGTHLGYLVADTPRLHTGVPIVDHAQLMWSEVPFEGTPAADPILRATAAYNSVAKPPLRKITYRALYRLPP